MSYSANSREQQLLRLQAAAESVVGSVESSRASATASTPTHYNQISLAPQPPVYVAGYDRVSIPPPQYHQHHHLQLPPGAVPASASSTSFPVIVSDDVVSGTKRDGWMSPVRRFFCLLATFDFLFVGLLWFITVIVTGRDIKRAFVQQIMQYTIHDSMFDCVVSINRTEMNTQAGSLKFFSALDGRLRPLPNMHFVLRLPRHRSLVACCGETIHLTSMNYIYWNWISFQLTTSGTSVFIVAKVFVYQWSRFGPITFDVMLVLISFILAWGEVWFLDFRVLPLEEKAKEIQGHLQGDVSDRTPLLIGGGAGRSAMLFRYMDAGEGGAFMGRGAPSINVAAGTGVESLANFYSPLESPEDSGDELEEQTLVAIPKRFKRKMPLNEKVRKERRKEEDEVALLQLQLVGRQFINSFAHF
jgi:hypothetical protein